jgi:phage-related protein
MHEIEFYKTNQGKCYVEDFLDSLPAKVAQKVTWVLSIIEEGEIIPKQFFKKLSGSEDIWECRIEFSSDIYRIFCFFGKGNTLVLTHGFHKKSQKTPLAEISKAQKYKKDYESRQKS